MKPINTYEIDEWSFNDCVDWLAVYGVENIDVVAIIAKRLRELHEKYRWIPVQERLPSPQDGEHLLGRVLWMSIDGYVEAQNWAWQPDWAVWWQRIDKPEGV